MQFPSSLKQNDRRKLPENCILSWQYMYARHPRSHWSEDEDFPQFETIRSKQSFNWSAFSIPIWARFNDLMEYQSGYGVAGYRVKTIRRAHEYNDELPKEACGIKHDPIENNYSHCELYPDRITRSAGRLYRLTLKNNVKRPVRPAKDRRKLLIIMDHITMYLHRTTVRLKQLLSTIRNEQIDP